MTSFAVESFWQGVGQRSRDPPFIVWKCKHLNKLLARLCGRTCGFYISVCCLIWIFLSRIAGEVRDGGEATGGMKGKASCKEFLRTLLDMGFLRHYGRQTLRGHAHHYRLFRARGAGSRR